MSTQLRNQPMTPVSPISELSSLREENMHAVRMQRVDTPTAINLSSPVSSPMPSWLREAVAERKRQLAASRALASPDPDMGDKDDLLLAPPSKLTKQHFGIPVDDRDNHHHFVSEWLNGLPERLIDGWQTVLREEVQETFGNGKARRQTRNSQNMDSQLNEQDTVDNERRETFFEDVESEEFDYCPGAAPIADGYSTADDDEEDDEFLVKVLLGRKRLMQAESSMKRLKMGLKHVTSGICAEFSNITDTERTQELLAEVDNTFKDVVRKRLSNATAIRQRADNNDGQNRRRLRAMRDKDPGFILRVYNEREIKELKTMVADILGMDERSGDTEGTDWFWNMLPRLLELRGDMAEAEREFARQRKAVKNCKYPILTEEAAPYMLSIYSKIKAIFHF
jgi:hypothetical protein